VWRSIEKAPAVSAFLICDVTVKSREALGEYLRLSEPTVKAFGGQFRVQAGALEVLEGDWTPRVIIVAEFPDMESARKWYGSTEYASALAVKPRAIDRNMILVEGLNS
jgi:uncharacterized protein (DUF1330 family)